MASSATRLSVPCTLALTITARPTPSLACNARKSSSGASGGVYGRPSAYGYFAPGPKIWQCASQASGGSTNFGVLVSGSGPGIVGVNMASCGPLARVFRMIERWRLHGGDGGAHQLFDGIARIRT